jgi:hypothetical protein
MASGSFNVTSITLVGFTLPGQFSCYLRCLLRPFPRQPVALHSPIAAQLYTKAAGNANPVGCRLANLEFPRGTPTPALPRKREREPSAPHGG